jgi:hypothetical protein
MFEGKFSFLRNLFYLILLGLHTFLFAYFFYYTWFNYMIIISSLSSIGLVGLALYSFFTTKSYYYYFYIGIILGSIPLVFVIYISAVLILPELIILFMLMYRGLTYGEPNIKVYEAGLINIPTNLTTIDVIPRKGRGTKEFRNLEKKSLSVKMVLISLLLTAIFFSSSIISIYIFNL